MAEEQRWEEHRLCANNCGFFGTTTTNNLCSKCYNAHSLKKDAQIAVEKSLLRSDESESESSSSFSPPILASTSIVRSDSNPPPPPLIRSEEITTTTTISANRCGACKKRVGLTAIKCKCGVTFCGSHRYPEKHGCGFDYKALGREEIKKANPVVKGKKLDKI